MNTQGGGVDSKSPALNSRGIGTHCGLREIPESPSGVGLGSNWPECVPHSARHGGKMTGLASGLYPVRRGI